jgi:4-aminobutyrate aminotransferase/(S)-3-amino-2-methylpropionate transaminase
MFGKRVTAGSEARSTGTTIGPRFISGQGPFLQADDGSRWFDGTSGSGAATLGHQHPGVTAAVAAQLTRLTHTGCKLMSSARVEFVDRLAALAPYRDPAVLPTVTGAEAVEAALKVARAVTGRRAMVAFRHAYHGKTAGALALTWREEFQRYTVLAADTVLRAELPDPRGPALPGLVDFAARLTEALDKADLVGGAAAVILEPVQVTEGVLKVSAELLDEIARQAEARGALLILDEIYTGLGRAGRLFTSELMTAAPDLTLLGKTLGNGFPIAAVVGERAVIDALPAGVQTSTFSGHPVSCAAASAVLDTLVLQDVAGKARDIGRRLEADLDELTARHQWLSAPRVVGGLAAFDCVDAMGRADSGRAATVLTNAARERLLLFGGGPEGATVKIVPPVLLTDDEYRFLSDALGRAIAESQGRW